MPQEGKQYPVEIQQFGKVIGERLGVSFPDS